MLSLHIPIATTCASAYGCKTVQARLSAERFRASGLQKRTRSLPGLKLLLAKPNLLVSMTQASVRGPSCA